MVLTLANQKGGCGKTTTCQAIVSGAAYKGKSSLAIDLDPQGTLSYLMQGDVKQKGSYELLTGTIDAADLIQHTAEGDIITSSPAMSSLDSILTGKKRVYALRNAIAPIRARYDLICLDCPPGLGTILLNALVAADGVVIPLRAKMTNLQGLYQLDQTIKTVQKEYNPDLKILGALFTEHNGRTNASKAVLNTITETANNLGIPVFNTKIRQGVAVDESQIVRKNLFAYAPKSHPAKDYLSFLDELGIC